MVELGKRGQSKGLGAVVSEEQDAKKDKTGSTAVHECDA